LPFSRYFNFFHQSYLFNIFLLYNYIILNQAGKAG
jgi:hypothetical protein